MTRDPTTLLILGGVVLVIIVAALVVLNRSWGNFPDRAGTPPAGPAAPGMSQQSAAPQYSREDEPPAIEPPISAAEPPHGLVPIEHPMVRRAAESALEKNSSAARYIVRDGDRLYFSFDQISDPVQCQAAYDLMRRFNAGEDVDLKAMLKLVQQLFM